MNPFQFFTQMMQGQQGDAQNPKRAALPQAQALPQQQGQGQLGSPSPGIMQQLASPITNPAQPTIASTLINSFKKKPQAGPVGPNPGYYNDGTE